MLCFLLAIVTLARAQTVTQTQWWFDDNYSDAITESASGRDFVWRKTMSTASLTSGFHRLNIRFRDNAGNWSGATSHYFLKLDGVHGNVISNFEYWYGNDFEQRLNIPLSTVNLSLGGTAGIILNLPMDTVHNGLHQLNYRVGYVNGVYSAISTTYFYKLDNVISEGNMVFDYWIDDNFEGRRQQTFANTGAMNTLNLDLSGFSEGGMHRLNYRIGNQGGAFGNVHTHYFFNNRAGTTVLEWTFDDNPTVHTRQLNGLQENVVFDMSTSELNNSVHSVHFRTGYQNGTYSAPTTAYFMKGANPYTPAQQNGEQLVAEYLYWFDGKPEEGIGASIAPVNPYIMNKDLLVNNLDKGKHSISIKFRDNFGKWSETVTDTFKVLNGNITKAKIKNLEPNVNPISYAVKNLATIYRYYRIVDELGEPIAGAQIDYDVEKKLYAGQNGIFNHFSSAPSDENGITVIEFKTWGKNIDTDDDDYVAIGYNPMYCKGIRIGENQLEVLENDFGLVQIRVAEYYSDESTVALELSAGGSVSFESDYAIVKMKAGLSDKFKMAFKTSKDFYGNAKETTFEFSNSLKYKGNAGLGLKTSTPFLKIGNTTDYDKFDKFKQEESFSTLKATYELLNAICQNKDNADTKLFSIVKAIGHFVLDENAYLKQETSTGLSKGNTDNLGIEIGFGQLVGENEMIKMGGIKIDSNNSSKYTVETGTSDEFNSIYQMPLSSNFVKMDKEGSISLSASYTPIGTGETYGAGATVTQGSGVKVARKREHGSTKTKEGSISITKGANAEVNLTFPLVTVNIFADAEYDYKYTFKKPLFENANAFNINDPLWKFMNNEATNAFPNVDNINNNMEVIANGFTTTNPILLSAINNSFEYSISKNFEAAVGVSKEWEMPKWAGFKAKFEFAGKLSNGESYPIGNGYYYFPEHKLKPLVVYADLDKISYWADPVNKFNNYVESMWNNVTSLWTNISNKAEEYFDSTWAWITGDDDQVLTNAQTTRQYAYSLKNYSELRSSTQMDKSIMGFHIPGNAQSFADGTQVDLEWFYPGGELLGIVENQDTMVVISDLFFLKAMHKWDTLSVAPNGNFKLYATVGDDDLAFLEINRDYPISVYYQSLQDSINTWHLIGTANDTIQTDKLGMYCLGIVVSSDHEPPTIAINKEEDADIVEITITDNMAVYWKNVMVLLNGVVTEYGRNGNILQVQLNEEQQNEDIYITVYATDLARNEAQATAIYEAPTGIMQPTAKTGIKLYPNPATDICYLQISSELYANQKLAYAIVSPRGQLFAKSVIHDEKTDINVNELPSGVYFVVVYDEKQVISSQKLIKK